MQMRKMSKPQLPKLQSKTFLYGIFRSFIAIIAKSTPAIFLFTQNTNESALEKANSKILHCQEVSFQQNLPVICIFGKDQSNNTQGQESLNYLFYVLEHLRHAKRCGSKGN